MKEIYLSPKSKAVRIDLRHPVAQPSVTDSVLSRQATGTPMQQEESGFGESFW